MILFDNLEIYLFVIHRVHQLILFDSVLIIKIIIYTFIDNVYIMLEIVAKVVTSQNYHKTGKEIE